MVQNICSEQHDAITTYADKNAQRLIIQTVTNLCWVASPNIPLNRFCLLPCRKICAFKENHHWGTGKTLKTTFLAEECQWNSITICNRFPARRLSSRVSDVHLSGSVAIKKQRAFENILLLIRFILIYSYYIWWKEYKKT